MCLRRTGSLVMILSGAMRNGDPLHDLEEVLTRRRDRFSLTIFLYRFSTVQVELPRSCMPEEPGSGYFGKERSIEITFAVVHDRGDDKIANKDSGNGDE